MSLIRRLVTGVALEAKAKRSSPRDIFATYILRDRLTSHTVFISLIIRRVQLDTRTIELYIYVVLWCTGGAANNSWIQDNTVSLS